MATVLEECSTKEQRSVVFLWAKGPNAKDIHKEIFPVYGWKCLSRKTIHTWAEKRAERFADDEVAATAVKTLLYCRFRRTGKAMGQVYRCWWGTRREIHFFSSFEYHMFYVLCPFVTNLLTLPRAGLKRPLPYLGIIPTYIWR
jgi:hypothetical protein